MTRLLCLLLLSMAAAALEPAGTTLGTIKRIYIESLGSAAPAIMLHDMIVASLSHSGLFVITENADHADAVLRGSADDQVFNEQHQSSDSLTAGIRSSASDYYSSKYDRTNQTHSGGVNIGENESSHSVERHHEASASVRLVNREGDVIWSTTQESGGAKFRSASADVADKVLHKLTDDFQKARPGVTSAASAAIQAGIPSR